MKRTLEQQLAEAEAKVARLKTKKRTKDTRRKIVVGAALLAELRENKELAALVLDVLKRRVTREVDRRDIASLVEELERLTGNDPT